MVYSQSKNITSLIQTNQEFFSPLRENVYLHLNKTTFIEGERIWFTAYVFDQANQIPSASTSNLYVALINSEGLQIKHSLIYIENGVGNGDFLIDGQMKDQTYYIRAWTNAMRNFEEVLAFKQEIFILRPNQEVATKAVSLHPTILIAPEGGNILDNAYNTIGFQLQSAAGQLNKNPSIRLINSSGGIVVSDLKLNKDQLGTVRFYQKSGEKYKLQVIDRYGNKFETALPLPIKTGMNLEINSVHPSFLILTIHVDVNTLKKKMGKAQYLAIRKNGQLQFHEVFLDSTTTTVRIPRGLLKEGVSTVTLFDSDLNPISERLVFKEPLDGRYSDYLLSHYRINATRDSLMLDLKPGVYLDSMLTASISVLPLRSQAYKPDYTIKSAFLLRPYLNTIGSTFPDFPDQFDREFLYNLDASLIQNGAGSYPWKIIKDGQPQLLYSYENGIEIKGRILDADLSKEKKVWFFTEQSHNGFYANLNNDKTFHANEILFSEDSLRISVIGESGELRKPKAEIEFISPLDTDSVSHNKFMTYGRMHPTSANRNYDGNSIIPEFVLSDSSKTILLNEVVVTDRRKADSRDIAINSALDTGKRITDEDIRQSVTVINYLRKLGYKISIGNGTVSVLSKTIPPGPYSNYVAVPVTLGGMRIDGSELLTMPLSRVQSIYADDLGYKYISLNQYWGHYGQKNKKRYISFPIHNGYVIPKNYVPPTYPNYENELFKKYGGVYWEPRVRIIKNASTTIKIPIDNQEGLQIHLEGMTMEGELISKKEEIKIDTIPLEN